MKVLIFIVILMLLFTPATGLGNSINNEGYNEELVGPLASHTYAIVLVDSPDDIVNLTVIKHITSTRANLTLTKDWNLRDYGYSINAYSSSLYTVSCNCVWNITEFPLVFWVDKDLNVTVTYEIATETVVQTTVETEISERVDWALYEIGLETMRTIFFILLFGLLGTILAKIYLKRNHNKL